ncbi:sensor histidine kinase [Kutzneria sp. CA-103260]|uniref:sensor histidine kinase n=1 Tax=Kutzneria sp. CA-103260 TaxID=2802641 RepID=UPI001BA6F2F9|nr:sensor histidine kinase [Kutzneria sp. CA-103260]QUQ69932.1 two-component system histidine kinase [Kutzneria sp. CA-103260]
MPRGRARKTALLPIPLAVGCLLIALISAHWHKTSVDALSITWVVSGAVPLFWRKRWPYAVLVLSAVLAFTYFYSGYPGAPTPVYPAIALYTLAKREGPIRSSIAGLLLIGAHIGAQLATGGDFIDPRVVAFVPVVISIGTAARNVSDRRQSQHEYFEERARRIAEEERLRIAREVHDVVAHSLAMINVQAGVGAHVADRRPEEAKQALLAIKEASRAALVDLRATLGVLRSGEDRAPAPSLARIDELLAAARGTGLSVEVSGDPGDLPAPVDSTAYRIVQEALTNTVRHAVEARTVSVRFARADGSLTVEVQDDGQPVQAEPGNGVRGMRERALALGGTLLAQSRDEGGFVVRAELPL